MKTTKKQQRKKATTFISTPSYEKVVKKVEEKPKEKRITKYFATYIGKQKHISLSPGIGEIIPGESFEVKESVANTLKQDPEFRVKEKYEYVDI